MSELSIHHENNMNQNARRPLVINKTRFGGIFPRKGEKCVRIDPDWRYGQTRWIPVKGREVVIAKQVLCSESYLPVDHIDPQDLAKIPEWKHWGALDGSGKQVWMRDLPIDGVRLAKDWRTYRCDGPSTDRFTVPAGTRIFSGDGGDATQAGYHWEA